MGYLTAGVIGGLTAGAVTSGVRLAGRDTGLIDKTLAENARDWLNRKGAVTTLPGSDGYVATEQGAHYAVSAALGVAYGLTRPFTRFIPPTLAGILFGAGAYALNAGYIAPELGVTRGEQSASADVTRERLAVHVAFGLITALVVASLVEG